MGYGSREEPISLGVCKGLGVQSIVFEEGRYLQSPDLELYEADSTAVFWNPASLVGSQVRLSGLLGYRNWQKVSLAR